ncbi:hypothetical protein BDR05DRAFT_966983 [Suillus weaverae]|nr:hypothetical protein BDR05DRAFT_966983 [Suillus weaverae]
MRLAVGMSITSTCSSSEFSSTSNSRPGSVDDSVSSWLKSARCIHANKSLAKVTHDSEKLTYVRAPSREPGGFNVVNISTPGI